MHHDDKDDDGLIDLMSIALVDKMHDPDLTRALGDWGVSQEVGMNKLGVTCLRLAALCVANVMHKNKPARNAECNIIEAYANYFHYYVHVGIDIIDDDAQKNKSQRRK